MIETLSSYHSHKFGGCLWDFSYNPESKIGLFLLDLPFTKVDSRHSRRMWSHSSSYNCFEQDLSCHVNRLSMMHFKYNLCMKVEMLTLKMCEKPWSMQNLPHFLIYHVLKSPSSICYWTRESAVYSSVMCAVHCTPYYFPCFITVLPLSQQIFVTTRTENIKGPSSLLCRVRLWIFTCFQHEPADVEEEKAGQQCQCTAVILNRKLRGV